MRRAVGDVAHAHGGQGRRDPALDLRHAEQPMLRGPNATSSRTVGMNSWSSGSWKIRPDAGAQLAQRLRAHVKPATSTRPRPQQPVEVQHQRRLAGAVGPEHGDPLSVRDVKVDAVERQVTPLG